MSIHHPSIRSTRRRQTASPFLLRILVTLLAISCTVELAAQGRRGRRSDREKNHSSILSAFRSVVAPARASTVEIRSGDDPLAYGLVLDSSGQLVSKASQLRGALRGRYGDGQESALTVLAVDRHTDLALLAPRETLRPLPAVAWAESSPSVGSLLATAGIDEDPIAIGVVSVSPRPLRERGILGIRFVEPGTEPRIARVFDDTGAARAGIEDGDVVTRIAGIDVTSIDAVIEVLSRTSPGETLELALRREDRTLTLDVTLGSAPTPEDDERTRALTGALSERRGNFPSVLQHDTYLLPRQCGSAIVDLEGRVAGINIARAGRVDTYALPVEVVVESIERLRSGDLAPRVEFLVTLDVETIEDRLRRLELELSEAESVRKDAASAVDLAQSKLDTLEEEIERLREEMDRRRALEAPQRRRI